MEQTEPPKSIDLLDPDAFLASLEKVETENPRSLLDLLGKGQGCFKNAEEVDAFIRAERDAWEDSETVVAPERQNFPDISEFHSKFPKQEIDVGEFCRKMRDEDRY